MSTGADRVELLFAAAVALERSERTAYLDRECAPNALDAPVRAQVEELLAASEQSENYFSNLAGRIGIAALFDTPEISQGVETADFVAPEIADLRKELGGLQPGAIAGGYRLIRELGSGGMGSVWLAERTDGLMNRRVALKLPHGAWRRAGLAERMAREREILAALNHPNIATLYDAGIAADGQPYLALEYVEGKPIDVYCTEHALNLSSRLALLLQVASAVVHAHAKLVVHRDLKPSNILVTADGQVRLLDFGIAKLLDDGQAKKANLTELSGRALTPDYASPEQIKGETIGTAADVYSLGVVAYELLTGAKPYKLKRHSVAALEELIVSGDPPLASDVATDRTRKRELKGDLDAILNKALKKNPSERYATVDAFAQDVERHLEGEPVHARPDSAFYRMGKFAARNKLAVGFASTLFVTITIAALLLARQVQVAGEKATLAQREAQRAEAVQGFLLNLFRTNTDAQADPVKARSLTARELLDIGAARAKQELHDTPQAQEAVFETLVDMYTSVGEDDSASVMNQQLLELRRRIYGSKHPLVAKSLIELAQSLGPTEQRLQAHTLLAEAKTIVDARRDTPDELRIRLLVELSRSNLYTGVTAMRDYASQAVQAMRQSAVPGGEIAMALRLVSRAQYWLGDWDRARVSCEEGLTEARRDKLVDPGVMITALVEGAEIYQRLADIETAEQKLREALDLSMRRNGAAHIDTVQVETRLGNFLHATGRRAEAKRLMASALEKAAALRDQEPNLIAQVQQNESVTLFNEGQFEAAAVWSAKDVELKRRVYPNSTILAGALYGEARLQFALGHYDLAARLLDEGSEALRVGLGSAAEPVVNNRFVLLHAQIAIARGEAQTALDLLQKIAPARPSVELKLFDDDVVAGIARSAALLQLERKPESLAAATAAVDLVQKSSARRYFPRLEADALLQLGRAQNRTGASAAAHDNLERALALRSAEDDPSSPWIAATEIALADSLTALGHQSSAWELLRKAEKIHSTHKELGAQFTQPLVELRRRLERNAS